jgi:Fe2+ transport system protein B
VVVLLSLSTAIAEETGLKDRVTAALDPWLRRIGLHGRDLLPVLTGFGCNVVAVFQTRSCSSCTRTQCVSMISFGSACSYQIGATLSVFSAAGHPALFAPCLLALFLVGAIHNRLWHGALNASDSLPIHERAFLQAPSLRSTLRQFLLQAMPIFLLICLVAAFLEHSGALGAVSTAFGPALSIFQLPPETAPAILFSILRKDGLLTLNMDDGAMLASLSIGQVFVAVWLAGTLTACLVTLWTVRKELGSRTALTLAGRQALTSLGSTLVIALIVRWI